MSAHAGQRQRILAAMRERPEGVTSKDFPRVPRVAARILELRAAGFDIPFGEYDGGGFAIYRLASSDKGREAPLTGCEQVAQLPLINPEEIRHTA